MVGDLRRHIRIRGGSKITLLVFITALLLIIFATLMPLRFRFSYLSLSDYFAEFTYGKRDAFDFIRNILLFMPFGFILGAILDRHGWSKLRVFFTVLFSGLLLTLAVESLQQFLPIRQASIYDLVGNTLGSVVGLASYRIWRNRHSYIERVRIAKTKPRMVLAALAIYTLVLLVMANSLAASARISSWDTRYHLMLGNDWKANRHWIGSLQNLEIFNEALAIDSVNQILNSPQVALTNNDSLQAYYPFTGSSPYEDLSGKLPDLIWQKDGEINNVEGPVQIDGRNWLATYVPVSDLIENLEAASQFSIRLTARTADVEQSGPARILSISENPFFRNLTIGQESDGLVIRFRSPLSGDNGATPQFLFPDFFNSTEAIDFAVTYDGLAIDLIDNRSPGKRSIEVVPGIAFYVWLKNLVTPYEVPYSQITVGEFFNLCLRLLFYFVVFLPVGVMMALRSLNAWPKNYRLFLKFCSLILVPFLVELILVTNNGFHLRPQNILTGAIVIAVISWIIMPVIFRFVSYIRGYLPSISVEWKVW
jgi:glycopeptide antibiotics resistance protein